MKQAVIVACGRSAFGRSRGSLRYTRPEDLCAQVARGVLDRAPQVAPEQVEDLILGCSTPECEHGLNMARNVVPLAGLPDDVAGQTINRFCSSGLQAIATAANAIVAGQQKVVLAGGVESMSCVPMIGARYLPDPDLLRKNPNYYLAMGVTAEIVAERYGISRERQDAFSAASHQKAFAAREAGKFREEIIPVMAVAPPEGQGIRRLPFDTDEAIRPDTTPERLAKLRTIFKKDGTVTAGSSSQISDGGALSLLMEEGEAKALGIKPLARFVSFAVAGVGPEVMGIGPVKAVPKALALAGLSLSDIDLIELNEAFASQSLACIDALGLDPEKVNVNGGAIAMGHPLGCTGAALTAKLLSELRRRGGKYGMVTMCIGGGQGAAGIFQLL